MQGLYREVVKFRPHFGGIGTINKEDVYHKLCSQVDDVAESVLLKDNIAKI